MQKEDAEELKRATPNKVSDDLGFLFEPVLHVASEDKVKDNKGSEHELQQILNDGWEHGLVWIVLFIRKEVCALDDCNNDDINGNAEKNGKGKTIAVLLSVALAILPIHVL